MPIPFLNSIKLNKNQVEDFCVFNYSGDPTLSSGADYGYLWLNTSASPKVLKFWDGTNYRTLIDSTTISSSTAGTANDLSGGVAGSLPYQQGVGDTTFLGIGTADQVLTVNSGATAPQWLSQSSLSVGSATNKTGGNLGDLLVQTGSGTTSFLNAGTAGQVITSNGASPQYVNQSTLSVGSATTATTATNVAGGANGSILVQSGVGTTGQLAIGANGYILTSNGTTPGWSATIPSTSVSGLAASATTDTTNASNISSGTLGLARLSLATGQFYVGDASGNPAATAKSSIPLSGFGAAGADVAMGGFKITGLADPSAATDAATRGYVDSVAQGLDVKASCLVATTADITLASPGAVTIDGIYSATDFTAGTTRILVRAQNTASQNGIYIWQGPSSAMTRSADADTWDELVSAFTFIEKGDTLRDTGWVCTIDAGTLGTTAVTWSQFSGAGSYTANRGLVLSGAAFNFAQNSDYTVGDLPYATGQTTIGLLPDVATGNALISGGVATAPSWGKIGLTTHVSGTLPIANGGTGATTFTAGQVLYGNGTSAISSSANLFWDSSNNRLGIGTATPTDPLEVAGAIKSHNVRTTGFSSGARGVVTTTSNFYLLSSDTTTYGYGISGNAGGGLDIMANQASQDIRFFCGTSNASPTERLRIASDGVCTWSNVGGVANTAMTLNGTGLGVGVSPATKFDVALAGAGTPRLQFTSVSDDPILESQRWSGSGSLYLGTRLIHSGGFYFQTAPAAAVGSQTFTTRMTLDASGNLALGTATANFRADIQNASGAAILRLKGGTGAAQGGAVYVTYAGSANTLLAIGDKATILGGTPDQLACIYSGAPLIFDINGGERLRIKSTGQVNFVGLASDPAGAAGDVYYNSTSNRLKYHNGTAWVNTGTNKYSGALAGSGTSFTVTHNLGTRDVTVSVRKSGSTYDQVFTDVQMTDTNTVTIVFASSVTGSDYTVTVIG